MRVLQLTLSFGRGGRREAISTLIKGLSQQGIKTKLGCLEELGCSPDELLALGTDYESLNRRGLLDFRMLRRLYQICDREKIDVIHAHDDASQFSAALMRLVLPRVKLVATFHRSLPLGHACLKDRIRNAVANAKSEVVVTGSRERRDFYLKSNWIRPHKVIRIPFGVDVTRFCPDSATRDVVRRELGCSSRTVLMGAVGHFGEEKGIDNVLRGFADLSKRSLPYPIKLVVAGDGLVERRGVMHELARAAGPDSVLFTGFRCDIHRLMRAMDVFVHTPRIEAFGLVLAEAMASGLPVVATRVGGVPDLVRDGHTGWLVNPDCPTALADILEVAACNPQLLSRMGEAAQQIAKTEYSDVLYSRRYAQLYFDTIAGRTLQVLDEQVDGDGVTQRQHSGSSCLPPRGSIASLASNQSHK